jgi:tetratricopeptide (TPR) repeat protein
MLARLLYLPLTNKVLPLAMAVIIVLATANRAVAEAVFARIVSVEGGAVVQRAANGERSPVMPEMAIFPYDLVSVSEGGRVALRLSGGGLVRLGSKSVFKAGEESNQLTLDSGQLFYFSRNKSRPTITTPLVTASLRGTELSLSTDATEVQVAVYEGSVGLSGRAALNTPVLSAGTKALCRVGRTPVIERLVDLSDGIQWAVFIPAIWDLGEFFPEAPRDESKNEQFLSSVLDGTRRGSEVDRRVAGVLLALLRGDQARALADRLDDIAHNPTATFARLQALIAAGVYGEARGLIDHTLGQTLDHTVRSRFLAARALLELSKGEARSALDVSREAVSLGLPSSSAAVIHSLVLQANGQLEESRALLERIDTPSQWVSTRLAELQFASGDLPAARRALEEFPDRHWYAESVYGFVLLADREREGAADAFRRAIELNAGAGLPRVGRGLVAISSGEMEEGIESFEEAVHLEPLQALFRSYLGKGYFEADRSGSAVQELEEAVARDPEDPTPYLYRGILRIAQNDLIGALSDLHDSARRTDQRRVYRSKLLLDQDSATTGAAIGRVYRELGFQQLGRVTAAKSLYGEYLNPAAHRILSETQDEFFLADANLSERRIADLLAPLSINTLDSVGSAVSLNEYTALFDRDGSRTSLFLGGDSRSGGATVGVQQLHKIDNFGVGLFAQGDTVRLFQSDPSSSAGRAGVSLQLQPDWSTKIIADIQGQIGDLQGDLVDSEFVNGSVDLGLYHRVAPETTLLAQARYRRERTRDDTNAGAIPLIFTQIQDGSSSSTPLGAVASERDRGYSTMANGEVQLIDQRSLLTSIVTGRYGVLRRADSSSGTLLDDDLGAFTGSSIPLDSSARNTLLSGGVTYQSFLRMTEELILDLGIGWDRTERAERDVSPYTAQVERRSRFLPKAGLVWSVVEGATLRSGYSATNGISAFEDRTSLQPTMVGGITQRFADLPGTFAHNIGTGVDLEFRELGLFIGAEWIGRRITERDLPASFGLTADFDRDELSQSIEFGVKESSYAHQHLLRGYGYLLPSTRTAVGAEIKFLETAADDSDLTTIRDEQATVFVTRFFEGWWFATLSSSLRGQTGVNDILLGSNDEEFVLMNASVGRRFADRRGVVRIDLLNLLDQDFRLNQTTGFESPIAPGIGGRLVVTLNF